MGDWYSARCERQRAPRRLPERIRLSLQSPHVGLPRETVLSTGSTGGSGRSGPVCNSDQTTTCWGWWRQVNIPKPRWGDEALDQVKAVAGERWLSILKKDDGTALQMVRKRRCGI